MKIAIAQINPTVGDIEGNVKKIVDFAQRAASLRADLVVFPELAICGYPPMDLLLKDSFVEANLEGLQQIARQVTDIDVLVGFVDRNKGAGRPLHNACAAIQNGKVTAVQHKTLLPTYDVFDEDRYFEPAKEYSCVIIAGTRCGISICEDIWADSGLYPTPRYSLDPLARLREQNAQLLINISASPYTLSKDNVRHELVRKQATAAGLPLVYVNQVGGNDELIFDGRSIAVNAQGELIAAASAFKEDLLVVDIASGVGEKRHTPDELSSNIYEALVLGTRDYAHKCGFKQVVLGLSGGIDSAVVCALASAALGAENVLGVAMPSPYSSKGSVDDARALAKNLGIEFMIVPIEQVMQSYERTLEPLMRDTARDITEENIQARARAMILMSISNKFGRLVLTTGNKSELAVGYCTLYGDMCGGLAVISDLIKTSVYDLARYINRDKELIPLNTIEKPPSAELRPGQLDQDTLPPYAVLDAILQAYVEQGRSAEEIVKLGYEPGVVMDIVNRIDRSEYKRYQAAPGLKITARSFGSGWRMPIAQRFRERLNQPGLC